MNYLKLLKDGFHKHRFLGNTISSATLMCAGDLIEQYQEIQKKKHESVDWVRNLRMTLVGIGMGVINHYYYGWIDRVLAKKTVQHSVMKVIADQIIASPICIMFLFYSDGAMLGHSLNQINTEMKEKFVTIYTADCLFWPPLQYINFRYIHKEYRVIFLNGVQMFYFMFLSHIKYKKKSETLDLDVEPPPLRTRFVSLEGYMEGYHHQRY